MSASRRLTALAVWTSLAVLAAVAGAEVVLRDASTDRPLVLDQNVDYLLHNVQATGMRDAAALTLTGRINSVTIRKSSFGNIRSGENGKAAGLECAGAAVGSLVASDSIFFDSENQLASLKEGAFGRVTFQRCSFRASERFLKEVYADNPWRDYPPVTEFYNIDRLELLDNTFTNTIVIIHPSVRQVIIRGEVPGLQVEDKQSTQVIRLNPGEEPGPGDSSVAQAGNPIVIGSPE